MQFRNMALARRIVAGVALAVAGMLGGMQMARAERDGAQGFSRDDLVSCAVAAGYIAALTKDTEKERYTRRFYDFWQASGSDSSIPVADRARMMKALMTEAEVRSFTESCILAFATASRFTNRFADRTSADALVRWQATQQAARNQAAQNQAAQNQAPANTGPSNEQSRQAALGADCNAVLDTVLTRSTRYFRLAQKGVENWIRSGAYGVAYGREDFNSGCSAISQGQSQLQMRGCPAEYGKALQKFRNGYYIELSAGSGFVCD